MGWKLDQFWPRRSALSIGQAVGSIAEVVAVYSKLRLARIPATHRTHFAARFSSTF